MEFKGTKGTWILEYSSNSDHVVRLGSIDDGSFYRVLIHDPYDAQLISKSPQLLNDLNDLVWLIENHATQEEILERIDISKQLIKEATTLNQ